MLLLLFFFFFFLTVLDYSIAVKLLFKSEERTNTKNVCSCVCLFYICERDSDILFIVCGKRRSSSESSKKSFLFTSFFSQKRHQQTNTFNHKTPNKTPCKKKSLFSLSPVLSRTFDETKKKRGESFPHNTQLRESSVYYTLTD